MEKVLTLSEGRHKRTEIPMTVDMARDKATVKEKDKDDKNKYQVYTDRSDQNGGVGASAILYRNRNGERIHTLHYHLGKSTNHIIFKAEIIGIMLGLHLLTRVNEIRGMTVAVDSQAAIQATYKGHSNGTHFTVLKAINNILKKLYEKNDDLTLLLRWMPGHVGIECNEEANTEAKKAANRDGSPLGKLLMILWKKLQRSAAAIKKRI